MQKECQLMDNGDVYEIQRDGTIHKVGNINSRPATIYSRSAEQLKKWLWAVSIVGGLAIIGLIIPLVIVCDDLDYARGRWYHYEDLYDEEQSVASQTKKTLEEVKKEFDDFKNVVIDTYPIIIHDIKIGNVDYDGNIQTEYGNKIYDYNTMYLKPKIYYTGLESGDYTLKVKLYNSEGVLNRGSESPSGFTYSSSRKFYSGTGNTQTLAGWGSTYKGNYTAGTYRLEIWYEDICLKAKTFRIY